MKERLRAGKWRPLLGVLGVGLVAFCVSIELEGAPPRAADGDRDGVRATTGDHISKAISVSTEVDAKRQLALAKAGKVPARGWPIFEPIVVDYRDDEATRLREAGLLEGPFPLKFQRRNVTASVAEATACPDTHPACCEGGGCTFDIECEDEDPCTLDECDIDPGLGACSGTCTHEWIPEGQQGDCDDGLFCNGREYCDANHDCVAGTPASCCQDGVNDEYCTEELGTCVPDAPVPGALCSTPLDCGGSECIHCRRVCTQRECSEDSDNAGDRCTDDGECTNGHCLLEDEMCSDGLTCNGEETCDLGTGECVAGQAPCGFASDCAELRCSGLRGPVCTTDADCDAPRTCSVPGPHCLFGRCCHQDPDFEDPACENSACCFKNINDCVDAGMQYYPGDGGQESALVNTCGGNPPSDPNTALGCPQYSAGIMVDSHDPLVHPVQAGPISISPVAVPGPEGPGTVLERLGDDYAVESGSNILASGIRFMGGMTVTDRVSFEFWDADGNFIEDTFFSMSTGFGFQIVRFEPFIPIPANGYVAARIQTQFSADAKFHWFSASGAPLEGTNDDTKLFVNQNINASNFMAPSPGVLAFEITGDPIAPPTAGCCHAGTGTCTNELEWICGAQGTCTSGFCVGSVNDGLACTTNVDCVGYSQEGLCSECGWSDENPGGSCRTCQGGTANDEPCETQLDCNAVDPASSCLPNDDLCGGSTCSNNDETSCTLGNDTPCIARPNLCGNSGVVCDENHPDPFCPDVCSNRPRQICDSDADCATWGGTCLKDDVCGAVPGTPLPPQGVGHCVPGHCTTAPPCDIGACCSGTSDQWGAVCEPGHIESTCEGTCDIGVTDLCLGGINAGLDCTSDADCGEFLGLGTDCDPNCCETDVVTGFDMCTDVVPFVIPPLTGVDEKIVVTMTGDNSAATSTVELPDTCFDPVATVGDDPGWWEGFTLQGDCTRVRVDFCCSDPTHYPGWVYLSLDCSCTSTIGRRVDPYREENSDNRGLPYCDGDNLWSTYGLLPDGTYYYPVYSTLDGTIGPYQLHFTFESCPTAACCQDDVCTDGVHQLECDELGGFFLAPPQVYPAIPLCAGDPCTSGSCCVGPGVCRDNLIGDPIPLGDCSTPVCGDCVDLSDPPDGDCADEGEVAGSCVGFEEVACTSDIECIKCDTGGSGECYNIPGKTCLTDANCNPLYPDGNFTGGVDCFGGVCALDNAYSCRVSGDCATDADPPGPGCPGTGECCVGASGGGERALAQPNPCPVCEFQGTNNCQMFDDGTGSAISDLSLGSGIVAADDFIPVAGVTEIDSVCVWGWYITLQQDVTFLDCGEDLSSPDNFRVRVLADLDGRPDADNVIGESFSTSVRAIVPNAASTNVFDPPVNTYAYSIALNEAIDGLVPGTCYWLEVANDLNPGDQCFWQWTALTANSEDGNLYAAMGSDAGGYAIGAEQATDLAFCIPGEFDPGGCGEHQRKCCSCDGDCTVNTLNECVADTSNWQLDEFDTGTGEPYSCVEGTLCPPDGTLENDLCPDMTPVYVGTHPFSNFCTTSTDPIDFEDFGGGDDIPCSNQWWHSFVVPDNNSQPCTLEINQCGTPGCLTGNIDLVLAVYRNPLDPTVCPCPEDGAAAFVQVEGRDDRCAIEGWCLGSYLTIPGAVPGDCYTIMQGGYGGQGSTTGKGVWDIACGQPFCGNNAVEGALGEECDGASSEVCGVAGCNPPGHPEECQCAPPVPCGNDVVEGLEQCDGTDDSACPGLCFEPGHASECQCGQFCGDDLQTGTEECDGDDDSECPTRCIPAGELGECECLPKFCGNDYTDPGEECDGTDDGVCADGGCRPPGDAAGECTCACGTAGVIPPTPEVPPVEPFGSHVDKNRYISMVLPTGAVATGGGETAIRVTLTSLHHPVAPVPHPDLTAWEGNFRYVNSLNETHTCPDSPNFPGTTFRCAVLGCEPEYRAWAKELGGEVLHVTGVSVVPSSTYDVAQLDATACTGQEATCSSISTELSVSTAQFGDVDPLTDGLVVLDIARVVDHVKGKPYPTTWPPAAGTALFKPRVHLRPNLPLALTDNVGVLDIAVTVDAVKGKAYTHFGCFGPCTDACDGEAACEATPGCTP